MRNHIRLALLLAALATTTGLAAQLGPDAGGYTATDETGYSFINIASSGVRTLAATDDETASATIGFPFLLYGQSYSTVCVSSNGMLTFGGCVADAFANQDLTATPTPGNLPIVAPFWTDLTFLQPNADAVYFETLGTAPARQFIVQWNSAFPQNAPQPVTFQAVLYEGTNQIRFQYETLDAGAGDPSTNGGASTVGVCTPNGRTDGRCLQWSYAVPVLKDRLAILFSPAAPNPTEGRDGEMRGTGTLKTDRTYAFDFVALQEGNPGAELTKLALRVEEILPKGSQAKPRIDRFTARSTTAGTFSPDPALPGPGGAPRPQIDTVLLSGVGTWNNASGYRYEVLATDDAGPPHLESIRIRVWDPSNTPVVDVEGAVASGSIRSVRIPH